MLKKSEEDMERGDVITESNLEKEDAEKIKKSLSGLKTQSRKEVRNEGCYI